MNLVQIAFGYSVKKQIHIHMLPVFEALKYILIFILEI